DQPLQFAAILTDDEFREIERVNLRCNIAPHIIPSPQAYIVLYYKDRKVGKYHQLFEDALDPSEITSSFSRVRTDIGDFTISELARRDDVGSLYKFQP
ncbi:MAG: hypothetical protein FKY71_18325, partial [Spiribacter salinus]